MASPKQIIVMVGLLGATGAVWAPQVLRQQQDPGLVQEELPAILGEVGVGLEVTHSVPSDGVQAAPTAPEAALPPSVAPASGAPETPRPEPTDGGAAPGDSAGDSGAGQGLERRADDLLASIAQTLAAVEERRSAAPDLSSTRETWSDPSQTTEVVVDSGDGGDDQHEPDVDPDWLAVRSFLEESPVTALVVGQTSATALVGSRVVRPGDRLAGGLLEVTSIDRSGVRYRFKGTAVMHTLPPFRTTDTGGESQEGDEEAEAAPEEGASSEAGPPTTGGAE